MNHETNKNNQDEVDLIKLMNYFKNGVKSIFRGIGGLVTLLLEFVLLLKQYWIVVVVLTAVGAVYGTFMYPRLGVSQTQTYEMIIRTNPIGNYELYSYAGEVNSNLTNKKALKEIGINNTEEHGVAGMSIAPITKLEDEIQNYFQQIETSAVRGYETDSLYFQQYDIKAAKNNLDDKDYPLQKITFYTSGVIDSREVQNKFVEYFNNLPSIKSEQETRFKALSVLEKNVETNLRAIDSIMFNRATAAKYTQAATSEQVVVNSASRANVESDLMIHSEKFTKKLFGIQRMKSEAERGITVISNLRLAPQQGILETNNLLKYALFGFLLACIAILGIQFSKYLDKFSKERTNRNA